MRKIYSILLAAVSLLFSANLSAVDVTTRQQIQDAINGIDPGQTVNIRLMNDISVDAAINIYAAYAEAGKTVIIDLNGYNMNAEGATVFQLLKGTLNITGTGVIEKTEKTATDAIVVYGSNDATAANWSNLIIDKDVTLNVHGPQVQDKKKGLEEKNWMIESTNAITVMELKSSALSGYTTTAAAYGVNITIKGKVYGSKYGVKINGTITANEVGTEPGNEYNNLPYVYVTSTAEVWSAANTSNSVAIYSSGVGRFLIEGYVHGASGVYVKAGSVELNDAVVKSDYTEDFKDHKATKSGVSGGGSAITIESNKSYAGGQVVTIKGDTKVEGGTGYAVEETITNAETTKVSSVTVAGGTIEAGNQGAVILEKGTTENAEVVIVGGNLDNNLKIKDGENVETATVDEFFPNDGEVYVSTTVKNEDGDDVIVVTKLDDTDINKEANNSVVATPEGDGLIWDNSTATVETIQTSRTFSYIQMSQTYSQTLNIGDEDHNVIVKVGRIVMGTEAQIVIAAGSSLIITGDQGIYAPVNSNIVLNTQQGKPAQLIFSPAVISNRHPQATVMFTSKAYRMADGTNIYQFFGSPFTAVESVVASSNTYATQIDVWNKNTYERVGIINYDKVGLDASKAIDYSMFGKSFAFYKMGTNNPEGEEQTYTFTGRLIGNENPELPMYAGWAAMSNSYMGTIDLDALMDANRARRANGSQVNVTPYVYSQEGNELHWNANNPLRSGYLSEIAPMQPFMLKNDGGYEDIVNNYSDLVWTPATTPASAPARVAAMDMTKATIRVSGVGVSDELTIAESTEFTSGRDEFDAVMYPNTDINFYVMDEEKLSILATDDVENTYLGFASPKGGEFTMTFNGVAGKALTLIDLVNNTSVDMNEGATYTFTADVNEVNDYRFKVVGRHNAPTVLENTDAAVKADGIYTMTGMYLGNMSVWNALPAGVYVVNGEKRVK